MKLSGLEVNVFCQSTENVDLIENALQDFFAVPFQRTRTKGHWKNPITLLKGEGNKEKALLAVEKLKGFPLEGIEKRCYKSDFYLKLDVESLLDGKVEPGEDVQVVLQFKGYKLSPQKVADKVRALLKA